MKSCAEFYCRQIPEKSSLNFLLGITDLESLIQTSLFLFFGPSPSAESGVPADSTPASNFLGGCPAKHLSSKFDAHKKNLPHFGKNEYIFPYSGERDMGIMF